MTNLTSCEKLALEEVFDCLQDKHDKKFKLGQKHHFFTYKMMKFYVTTKKLLWIKKR